MDEETAIQRISEVENLTDSLEDEDANWLLDWGIQRVPQVIGGPDDEVDGDRLNQLMSTMRKINQITGNRQAKPPEELVKDIQPMIESYRRATHKAGPAVSILEQQKLAHKISRMSPRQALEALTSLVMKA